MSEPQDTLSYVDALAADDLLDLYDRAHDAYLAAIRAGVARVDRWPDRARPDYTPARWYSAMKSARTDDERLAIAQFHYVRRVLANALTDGLRDGGENA